MFAPAHVPVERPEPTRSRSTPHRSSSYQTIGRAYDHRSPKNTPPLSRSNSAASVNSVQSHSGDWRSEIAERHRQASSASTATSATTDTSKTSKSSFKDLFKKKDKKDKKDVDKPVLTSRHAAAVKSKMMSDPGYADHNKKGKPQSKTAGVVGTQNSGHATAAQLEMRHPHSGPPALYSATDMPMLTRIASGDDYDEEETMDRMQRERLEWQESKQPALDVARIEEALSRGPTPMGSPVGTPMGSRINSPIGSRMVSPAVSRDPSPTRRPAVVTRNSVGGRWTKDQNGKYIRTGTVTP